MKILIATLLILTIPFHLMAEELDYSLKNGRFYTSEGEIPDGCFGQLMTELNGDNAVAAIYLNRAYLRGCIAANYPYPSMNEERITYSVIEIMENHKYVLRVCQEVGGSMGGFCDKILVQFVNREYWIDEREVKVLSLEKLGDVL